MCEVVVINIFTEKLSDTMICVHLVIVSDINVWPGGTSYFPIAGHVSFNQSGEMYIKEIMLCC